MSDDLPPVLDPACGSRMCWFDKNDPRALFGDKRRETITVTDRTRDENGTRSIHVNPDVILDYRNLPFPDETFHLVLFDPPHLKRAGNGWQKAKYGALNPDTWQEDLTLGFSECFRVLKCNGTLIFKWNEVQIPLREILALTPEKPLFGHRTRTGGLTHWIAFLKQ